MSNSECTSCGLFHQDGQCLLQTSTTVPGEPIYITPAYCCSEYLSYVCIFLVGMIIIILGQSKIIHPKESCYMEFFVNSVSVSNANTNANVSGADWTIGFVVRSPVTGCKIYLHTLKSRLLRGNQVISSTSPTMSDFFGQYVAGDKTYVVFENVVMPEVTGDVIWNVRVEVLSGVKTDATYGDGFFLAACPDIPVKFTTDSTGKVMGSLLGNMRRCEYEFRDHLESH